MSSMDVALIVIAGVAMAPGVALRASVWRRSRRHYSDLWAPLVPLVRGTARGAALLGTWRGMLLEARVVTRDREDAEAPPAYALEIRVKDGTQGVEWAVLSPRGSPLGFGGRVWCLQSPDEAVRTRLLEAGLMEAAERLDAEVAWKASEGRLTLSRQIAGPYGVPAADVFVRDLEGLVSIAEVNRRVNASTPSAGPGAH